MSHESVEPMKKPCRERDFDRAETKHSRRFKKQNIDNGKRDFIFSKSFENDVDGSGVFRG